MEEERKNQPGEFVFVNRSIGVGAQDEALPVPQPKPRAERKKRTLAGEPFVLIFQAVLCLLVLLIFFLIYTYGGKFSAQLADGYHKLTQQNQWDITAYFEPIENDAASASSGASEAPASAASTASAASASSEGAPSSAASE